MSDLTQSTTTTVEPEPVTIVDTAPQDTLDVVPASEPEQVEAAEPVTEESAAEPIQDGAHKPRGAVKELMELRRESKQLKEQYEATQRELQAFRQGMAEGRILTAPPRPQADVERQALEATAKRLNLVKQDANGQQVYDLEAASRVRDWVKDEVRQEIAPIRNQTLAGQARANIDEAVTWARTAGYSEEEQGIIRDTFEADLQRPNGAGFVAQATVAKMIFERAMGRVQLHRQNAQNGTPTSRPRVAASAPSSTPPPVPVEPGGRRGPAPTALNETFQRIYRDSGLDPTKGYQGGASNRITLE
jgi:hypothetical protein